MANASTGANPIWNFFVKVPPGQEAQCLKCHSILKTPTGTTTTLATHLKRHPDVFVTYEKERCARKSVKSTAKPDVQQPSVADRFKRKLKHTAPKAQQMTKAIAGFIARGMHSYSVVEEPGFVAVMNAAMPEYVVPSRTTFSRAIIPELYASKKQNLMNSLQAVVDGGVEAISITTDSWTSRANESYLSVTCHIMDSSFQLHVHALACTEMADAHTAENLVLFLKSVMEEWALPDPGTVPVYVVTDNGRNFTAAITQSPWIGIKCFGHTLQLCVSDVKRDVPGFSQLCTKARAIVGRYKKSSKARGRLVEVQREMQLNALEVVQDVPMRWNSEHQMMTRLLKLRKPITVELSERDAVDNLTAAEWKLMTAAVKVLDPLAQATTELSGDKYPTLSQVIPLLECTGIVLARHTAQSDESSAIASSLARSIKARFPGVKTSEDTALAMLLDPRFKDACYTERAEKKWACAILTKAAEGTLQVLGCEASTESDTGSDSSQGASVWGAFASIASDGSKMTGPSIKDDVQNYLRAPLLPRCEDPLDWWKSKGSHLHPSLVRVARRYLSVPATQTTSERLFSTAGAIVTCRREHLLPQHVEQLVFLHDNF
ncbi:hypothetical protein HPB50_009230 [Hyalomma asiaticum]|uniref:Uncharacterized protein n=1 Tax=Hyalomma asiaticum TaxID=266040 RepID=A0ACB7T9J9_HYAAI|nr:hypothetical protein HPB50_009230 [Hyalomma asiaticum]